MKMFRMISNLTQIAIVTPPPAGVCTKLSSIPIMDASIHEESILLAQKMYIILIPMLQ
jgi:hypothetical protein